MKIGQERFVALQKLENCLGLYFPDKTPLHQALTHSSYAHQYKTPANERLEFLGDSVLDLIVAEWLFTRFPHEKEGFLTRTRAKLVNQNTLAALAEKLHLSDYLLIVDRNACNQAVLSDTFEAVLGAVYLCFGYEKAMQWILPHIQIFLDENVGDLDEDYKSSLQVFMQKNFKELPVYQLTGAEGPEHNQTLFVQVLLKGNLYGKGQGRNKKEAEQMAARAALQKLKDEGLYAF